MFQLDSDEFNNLRSHFVTSSWGGTRYKPFAFTEQGVAMLSSVLSSPEAIEINIAIVRVFVALRQYAHNYEELSRKISELEKKYETVYRVLSSLITKEETPVKRKRIGYKTSFYSD